MPGCLVAWLPSCLYALLAEKNISVKLTDILFYLSFTDFLLKLTITMLPFNLLSIDYRFFSFINYSY
jgi:hypothetical protein